MQGLVFALGKGFYDYANTLNIDNDGNVNIVCSDEWRTFTGLRLSREAETDLGARLQQEIC